MSKYDEIIDKKYVKSKRHKWMSRLDRAAQFSPFAALTGYEDEINEAKRIVDNKIELSENEKEILDRKLHLISEKGSPLISVTYFVKDIRKMGGAYYTKDGRFKKFDEFTNSLIFNDKSKIDLEDILDINLIDE